MKLEKKLLEEVARFNQINKYAKKLMGEQEDPLAATPAPDALAGAEAPAPDPLAGGGAPDPLAGGVPPIGGDAPMAVPEDNTEEIDITDLVNMTKSIKNDIDDSKGENKGIVTKMDDVFTKLDELEKKLASMDNIISKIDELGTKIEQSKEPTPQERLQMRSLDSYPFNQNPQQFFAQKQGEMRTSGKNEYVLTKDEIDNYSRETIRDTFNIDNEDEDEFKF
jgi:hypothetical protein